MPESSRATGLRAIWRDYSGRMARKEIEPSLRIGLAATFTANALSPFLGGSLAEKKLPPLIEVGPYNQIFQVCLDPGSVFHSPCDVIVMLHRLEDIMQEEITAWLMGDVEAGTRALEKIDVLASAVAGLRGRFSGMIIINIPPYPMMTPQTSLDLANPDGLGALHRQVTTHLVRRIREIAGVHLLDLDALQRSCGVTASFDARSWYLYRQPFTERFLVETGMLLSRLIAAARLPARKCIVLDCDNTLWGGIVGEEGVGGIQLGDEFPGSAYRDFQRWLLYQRERGVLLALASKNNEADVWEVFDQQSAMLLRREHLSAWQINWDAKSEMVMRIATALNIGLDSLVFIDDNAMEIEWMRSAHPEVESVLLTAEPADMLQQVQALSFFDRLQITTEDRQRADLMRSEEIRHELAGSVSREEFLLSLELRVELFLAGEGDLDRIAQLINKTNQFNLTTLRRTPDEVRVLAKSSRHHVFGLRVMDKFGDYGLTGVVIVEVAQDGAQWCIDTLLLSCRVLGRGVETTLLRLLAAKAREKGARELVASFIPTAKNDPARSYLPDHGFQPVGDIKWKIEVEAILYPKS